MAFLPVILDMVDEIYTGLDDESKAEFPDMNNIPFLFLPQPQQRPAVGCSEGMRHKRVQGGNRQFPKGIACTRRSPFGGKGQCVGGNCVAKTSDDFKVSVDVKSFKPEEISVKVKDREILIEGKHEERADDFGFISQQFVRRYVLPEEFDIDTVSTFLNAEGQMTIKAAKPKPAAVEAAERIIPIQRIPSDQGWENVVAALVAAGENTKAADESTKETTGSLF